MPKTTTQPYALSHEISWLAIGLVAVVVVEVLPNSFAPLERLRLSLFVTLLVGADGYYLWECHLGPQPEGYPIDPEDYLPGRGHSLESIAAYAREVFDASPPPTRSTPSLTPT